MEGTFSNIGNKAIQITCRRDINLTVIRSDVHMFVIMSFSDTAAYYVGEVLPLPLHFDAPPQLQAVTPGFSCVSPTKSSTTCCLQ